MKPVAPARIDVQAGIIAVLFPGAGHLYRGERARAAFACLGVMGLFLFGLLIGGLDAVDSREKRVWFFGQALVGPTAFVVDAVHQNYFRAYDPDILGIRRTGYPGERQTTRTVTYSVAGGPGSITQTLPVWVPEDELTPEEQQTARAPHVRSVAQENEIARLFCTIAGMVNLIVIFDALFPVRRRGNTP